MKGKWQKWETVKTDLKGGNVSMTMLHRELRARGTIMMSIGPQTLKELMMLLMIHCANKTTFLSKCWLCHYCSPYVHAITSDSFFRKF